MKSDLVEVIVVALISVLIILMAIRTITHEHPPSSVTVHNATIVIPDEGHYTFDGTLRLAE